MKAFTLNGKTYQTDAETLNVLRGIMPSAKATGDSSAVIAIIALGEATGRIVEVKTKRMIIGGIEMEITPERQRRIIDAIGETQHQIDREMGYSEEFRKHDNIARWEQHITKLQGMLAGA